MTDLEMGANESNEKISVNVIRNEEIKYQIESV